MITIFLPCRAGSERVKNKNTRKFSGVDGGLFAIKMESLLSMAFYDELVVSTNDIAVIDIASRYQRSDSRIKIIERPECLAQSSTKTDELIRYVPEVINEGIVLWTHVTSPFLKHETYLEAIEKYNEGIESKSHDSVMSVNRIQSFLWNNDGPLNYDYTREKWPRTQTIEPVYEINNAIFLADVEVYKAQHNRIGIKPFLLEISGIEGFDIDWEDDFSLAEKLWQVTR